MSFVYTESHKKTQYLEFNQNFVFNLGGHGPANPCSVNNGGCSDFCTFKSGKVVCTCKVDSIIGPDGKKCIPGKWRYCTICELIIIEINRCNGFGSTVRCR